MRPNPVLFGSLLGAMGVLGVAYLTHYKVIHAIGLKGLVKFLFIPNNVTIENPSVYNIIEQNMAKQKEIDNEIEELRELILQSHYRIKELTRETDDLALQYHVVLASVL